MRGPGTLGGVVAPVDEDSISVEDWIQDVIFDADPTTNVDRQGRWRRVLLQALMYASRIPLPSCGVAYLLLVSRTVYQEFVLQENEVTHCRGAEDRGRAPLSRGHVGGHEIRADNAFESVWSQ